MSQTRPLSARPYEAPYRLTVPQRVLPDEFLLPICITRQRFLEMWMVLSYGATAIGCPRIGEHNIDFLEALAFVDAPELTRCYTAPPRPAFTPLPGLPDCVSFRDCDGDGRIDTIVIRECDCSRDVQVVVYGCEECGC